VGHRTSLLIVTTLHLLFLFTSLEKNKIVKNSEYVSKHILISIKSKKKNKLIENRRGELIKLKKLTSFSQLRIPLKKQTILNLEKIYDQFHFNNGSLIELIKDHFLERLSLKKREYGAIIYLALNEKNIINYSLSRVDSSAASLKEELYTIIDKIRNNHQISRRISGALFLRIVISYQPCNSYRKRCGKKEHFINDNSVSIIIYNE